MKEKILKILLLEDNVYDVGLIERVLQKDKLAFISKCVYTEEEFRDAMREFTPDIVLSDHALPGFNSTKALEICIAQGLSIPFILVTGSVTDEYAISCLHHGADDYILKDNLSRLPLAIRSAIKRRKLEKLKREGRHLFRAQNKELSKVNKELDNFVYNVSHNMRGPLASLMGLLSITKDMDTNPEMDSMLNRMSVSIIRLEDTLEEIVDYSKNARNDIFIGEVNWKEILKTSYEKLEYLHPVKNFIKITAMDTDIPFYSDESRLSVLFNSILSNAIRYRQSEGDSVISVSIATTNESVIIKIRDNGIGIEPHIMPKIYDMFYRGTAQSQGAGLGLYIVKEVLTRLNGTIEISTTITGQTLVTMVVPNSRMCELAA